MLPLLLHATTTPATACSLEAPAAYEPDTASDDSVAPGEPGAPTVRVTRGKGPVCEEDCSCMSTSCDDLGIVSLVFTAALDDRSPEADADTQDGVGYVLTLVDGALAEGLELPGGPVGAFISGEEASLALVWIDDASDDQDAFEATVALHAVDLAGNAGPAVTFTIEDPGSVETDTHCFGGGGDDDEEKAICGLSGGGAAWLLAAGALAGRRRRR
ncbi:MAG: hypothetical protein ACOZNI_04000 [Myxococcota bacterium]